MKTQYYAASTLDGFIAAPGHDIAWLQELPQPDWAGYEAFIKGVGAIAMGAHTYEWMLRHQDKVKAALGSDKPWPYEQPCWVFTSRALAAVPGADLRFVRGDAAPVHGEMAAAAAGKNAWIVGGGDLAGQFYDAGLLDELIVTVASVTLGKGFPLLPRRITGASLTLVSARKVSAAFAELRYAVAKG